MTHNELMEKIAAIANDSPITDSKHPTYLALDALRAVVELHKPKEGESFLDCSICIDGDYTDGTHDYSLYPCETIEAIEKELK